MAGARGQEPVSVFISRKDAEALRTALVIHNLSAGDFKDLTIRRLNEWASLHKAKSRGFWPKTGQKRMFHEQECFF